MKDYQRRATRKYQDAHIRRLNISLNDNTDQDILTHLETVSNYNGYIKALIRADIARTSSTTADSKPE